MADRPNVIICMCDQLRAFELGCYGNEIVSTPNIDRLAENGCRFEQAVSNNPVCMPARSSLLTGQYSRTCCGALGNYTEKNKNGVITFPDRPLMDRSRLISPTLAETLREAGYATSLIGKWHIHPAPGLLGFERSLYPLVRHRHTGQTFIDGDGNEEVVGGYSLDYEADRVRDYLGGCGDDPFFLFYNISPPHMPLADAPEKYRKMYSPDDVPLRPNVYVDGKLPYDEHWFKVYLWDFLYYEKRLPYTAKLPDGFDLRHLTALYYGMVTWADDMVGRLLSALEETGRADNTIIIFTSDHGDNLGSHHRFNKQLLLEESIRIPLIFNGPANILHSDNKKQVAGLIDIMPTVLDLCGAEIPDSVQGRSLVPVFRNERAALDINRTFIETESGQVGVRTPDQLYGAQLDADCLEIIDEGCLWYDLTEDSYQMENLAGTGHRPEEAAALLELLKKWNAETPWLER